MVTKVTRSYAKRSIAIFIAIGMVTTTCLQTKVTYASETTEASTNGSYLDKITFGEEASETAHEFSGTDTNVVDSGIVSGLKARQPVTSSSSTGAAGDMTFQMKVDPYAQNYITIKYSGSDSSASCNIILVDGEKIEYSGGSDINPINTGYSSPLAGRFYYETATIPLSCTYGKDEVEITIDSVTAPGNETYAAYTHTQAYVDVSDEEQGSALSLTAGSVSVKNNGTDEENYSHMQEFTQAQKDMYIQLSERVDAMSGLKGSRTLSITRYVNELEAYANYIKDGIIVVKDEEGNVVDNPTKEQVKAETKTALERVFKVIDAYVVQYYTEVRNVGRALSPSTNSLDRGGNVSVGHQSDWGGYYHSLGEALFLIQNQINEVYGSDEFHAFLQENLETGTEEGTYSLSGLDSNGTMITRYTAWERCLKATYDYSRSRQSYIYNQVYYTYIGAWAALAGLGVIGSDIYEEEGGNEKANYILLSALGQANWFGEEELVDENDEDLDLYHDLFKHNTSAVFTEDVYQVVMKGLAKSKTSVTGGLDGKGGQVYRLPYGKYYTGMSFDGLTRENEYTGDYGEAANYLVEYFYATLEQAGYEEANSKILKLALKNIHARSYTRYADVDSDGNRVMRMEQVNDSRHQRYPGKTAYASGNNKLITFASLEWYMANHKDKYSYGDSKSDWAEYWNYAKEAVGFFNQALMDGQIDLASEATDTGGSSGTAYVKTDFYLQDTYEYIKGLGTAATEKKTRQDLLGSQSAGVVHPLTNFGYYTDAEMEELLNVDVSDLSKAEESYQQFAKVDLDTLYVTIRDGDTQILGSLYWLNKGMSGFGLLHVIYPNYDRIVQVKTNNIFQYNDYWIRQTNVTRDFTNVTEEKQNFALAGEVVPIAYQPGVGTVNRDNYEADTPYAGYADLSMSRYGNYYMVINTTREEYGNRKTYEVDVPTDYKASEHKGKILDLVSGKWMKVKNGKVKVKPKTAYVFKLDAAYTTEGTLPNHVDFVKAVVGNDDSGVPFAGITWKEAAGAESYRITRATSEDGPYSLVATVTAKEIVGTQSGSVFATDGEEGTTGTGNYFVDSKITEAQTYYYKVTAVNSVGLGAESYRTELSWGSVASANLLDQVKVSCSSETIPMKKKTYITAPLASGDTSVISGKISTSTSGTVSSKNGWNISKIGDITGTASTDKTTVTMSGVNGSGLGEGDDNNIFKRNIQDSFAFVNKPESSSFTITAKIDSYAGTQSGLMIRDLLATSSRYLYFGANADGKLILRNRTRDSRVNTSTYESASPIIAAIGDYSVSDYPYIALSRDYDTHYITAMVSKDGANWKVVGSMSTCLPYAVYSGVVTAQDAAFSEITIKQSSMVTGAYPVVNLDVSYIRDISARLTNTKGFEINLLWEKSLSAVKYDVVRYDCDENNNKIEGTKQTIASGLTKNSYLDSEVTYGNTYCYTIVPYDKKGTATEGSVEEVFTLELPEGVIDVLSVVTGENAFDAGSGSWTSSGENTADRYTSGMKLFDGDSSTNTDTYNSKGVSVDFGSGNGVTLTKIRLQSVNTSLTNAQRLEGAYIQGSNDGTNWMTLTDVIPDITATSEWVELSVKEDYQNELYQYIRIYKDSSWYCNVAELQLYGSYYNNIQYVDLLKDVTIQSNNVEASGIEGTTIARTGDQIALSFTAVQPIKNVKVEINDTKLTPEATASGDNTIYTATYTVAAEYTPGAATFRISYQSENGTFGNVVTATTDGSSVVIKKTFVNGELDILSLATVLETQNATYQNKYAKDVAAKFLFDLDKNTWPDSASYYVQMAFTEGKGVKLNKIKLQAVNSVNYSRINGTYLEGSNDGVNYVKLTDPAAGITQAAQWAELPIYENYQNKVFHYLRLSQSATAWYCNIAEAEFYGEAGDVVSADALQSVTMVSDQEDDTSLARPGNTITLSFTAASAIKEVAVTINNSTVTANATDDTQMIWNAVYTVPEGTALTSGVPFCISYTDSNENEGTVTEVTSGTTVRIRKALAENEIDVYDLWSQDKVTFDSAGTSTWGPGDQTNKTVTPSFLFDCTTSTYANINGNWMTLFLKEGALKLSQVDLESVSTKNYARLNGVYIEGSNDGTNWTAITDVLSGITEANQWGSLSVNTDQQDVSYCYFRINNANSWYCNASEAVFYGTQVK